MKRRHLAWIAALAAAQLAGAGARADNFPDRPITMVVPFAPGGIADITARPLAQAMSKVLGQSVVIDNRAGAGGAIGHAYTAKARPDGYTIMTALSSIVVIPESDRINARAPSYQMSEFTPIALLSADPTVLVVRDDARWKSLADLLKEAREKPGTISYSSSGIYGTIHTCVEMLAQAAGVKFLHVPYKGGAPAMAALLGNEVGFTAQSPGVAAPHLNAGKARLLGSWAGERTKALPDTPTMKEQGFDVEFYIWAGVFAPAGVPQPILERISDAVRKAAHDPEFVNAMATRDTPVRYLEGKAFDEFLASDTDRLKTVVEKMGKLQ